MTEHSAPFRVALRSDKDWVRMHIAMPHTMTDAIPVVIINRKVAEMDEGIHKAVMALAEAIGAAVCRNFVGEEPVRFDVSPAAEEIKHDD
jgi:stage V sporulation protein SpoVS